MGLLDVLNGMQNAPRGQRAPGTATGGMPPITMALLGLLAYKAIKSFKGNQPNVASAQPGGTTGHKALVRRVADSVICSKVDWAVY